MDTVSTVSRGNGNNKGGSQPIILQMVETANFDMDDQDRGYVVGQKISGKPEFNEDGTRAFKDVRVYLKDQKFGNGNELKLNVEGLTAYRLGEDDFAKTPNKTKIVKVSDPKALDESGLSVEGRRLDVIGNIYHGDYNLMVTTFQNKVDSVTVSRIASGRAEMAVLSGDEAARRDQAKALVNSVASKLGESESLTIMVNGAGSTGVRSTVQHTVSRFEGVGENARKISNEELATKALTTLAGKSYYSFDGTRGIAIDKALASAGASLIVVPSERVMASKKLPWEQFQIHQGIGTQGYAIHETNLKDSRTGKKTGTMAQFIGDSALEAAGMVAPLKNLKSPEPTRPFNDSSSFNRIIYAHQNLNGLEAPAIPTVRDGDTMGNAQAASAAPAQAAPATASAAPAAEPATAGALEAGDIDFDAADPFDTNPS